MEVLAWLRFTEAAGQWPGGPFWRVISPFPFPLLLQEDFLR